MRLTHQEDLAAGFGAVYLPGALDRKYPKAAREWGWQYVFPARDLSKDPRSGVTRRHHLDEATINNVRWIVCKHCRRTPMHHGGRTLSEPEDPGGLQPARGYPEAQPTPRLGLGYEYCRFSGHLTWEARMAWGVGLSA